MSDPAASPAGGPAPLTEEDGERSAQSLDAAGWHREAALLRRLLAVAAHHRAEGVRWESACLTAEMHAERAEAALHELRAAVLLASIELAEVAREPEPKGEMSKGPLVGRPISDAPLQPLADVEPPDRYPDVQRYPDLNRG